MSGSLTETVRVIDSGKGCPTIPIVQGDGSVRVVTWPGNGAKHRTMQLIQLAGGSRTTELRHRSDSVYYVIDGLGGITDLDTGETTDLAEGAMVHIDGGDGYVFHAVSASGLKLVGGPCPADESLYADLCSSN